MQLTQKKAAGANPAAQIKKSPEHYKRKFNKSLLPKPMKYYLSVFNKISYMGNGQIRVNCCFHDDTHPSLSINKETGAYYCFGCGAKGGDIINFYQQINHVDFIAAVTALDAWEVVR